jgi:hypothetical protein
VVGDRDVSCRPEVVVISDAAAEAVEAPGARIYQSEARRDNDKLLQATSTGGGIDLYTMLKYSTQYHKK